MWGGRQTPKRMRDGWQTLKMRDGWQKQPRPAERWDGYPRAGEPARGEKWSAWLGPSPSQQ